MGGSTFDRIPIKEQARQIVRDRRGMCALVCLILTVLLALVSSVSAGVLAIVCSGLIQVTQDGFFLRMWRGEDCQTADLFYSLIDAGFWRKVGGMLWMQLQVFVCTLLLIVPGFIRAYSLFLTPYILADCPHVSATKASELSARMMRGHRVELFITQLSFVGWALLSACTCGILYIAHTGPYMSLTYAGIYEELRQIALDEGVITQQELDGEA